MTKYLLLAVISCIVMAYSCESPAKTMTTSNGYKYEIIKKGSGDKMSVGNYVYFNTQVSSIDGESVYNSSEAGQPGIMKLEDPATAAQANPFNEIFANSNIGDSIHIHLGKKDAAGSGFDSLLYQVGIFDGVDEAGYQVKMEEEQTKRAAIAEVSKAQETIIAEKVQGIYADIKSGKLDAEIKSTDSGLKYIIHEEGTGGLIEAGSPANVNYYGVLSRTGEEFDNSWKRGQVFSFPLGQGRVIKGWDEALAMLPKGSIATIIVPGDLGYGERGSGKIKANDELIFYLEVED